MPIFLTRFNMYYLLPWLLTLILYVPVFIQLYYFRWQMSDYSYAYFILPVALVLAWRKSETLTPAEPSNRTFNTLSLFLLGLGLLLYVFGWRLEYLSIATFSMVPVLFGLVFYFYGQGAAKRLSFPILYLLFLVPLPLGVLDSITLPIRFAVTLSADIILKLCDIPVVRDGLLLSLGGHEIDMDSSGSGLPSLATIFTIGLAYIYLIPLSLKNKITLAIAIIPLGLLGNLARIIITCLTAYYLGPKTAEGPLYFISGAAIFIMMLSFFIYLKKKFQDNETDQ